MWASKIIIFLKLHILFVLLHYICPSSLSNQKTSTIPKWFCTQILFAKVNARRIYVFANLTLTIHLNSKKNCIYILNKLWSRWGSLVCLRLGLESILMRWSPYLIIIVAICQNEILKQIVAVVTHIFPFSFNFDASFHISVRILYFSRKTFYLVGVCERQPTV